MVLFQNHGNQLIFASDRPGGFGGLDLYISQKINGTGDRQ